MTLTEFAVWRAKMGFNRTQAAEALGVGRNMPQKYEEGDAEIPRYIELACQQLAAPKVAGYTSQPDEKVALVNEFKQDEERLLRKLDDLEIPTYVRDDGVQMVMMPDGHWLAIARSHFEQGFMALNRAIFQPQRIKLPEDGE